MSKSNKQDRIEGEWAIVSVQRPFGESDFEHESDWAKEISEATERLAVDVARHGAPVEIVSGSWNGVRELSLRLHGPRALKAAAGIAKLYQQDAFIHAKDGVAYLHPVEMDYARGKAFTRLVEVADTEADDYTELGNGFRFRLLP